MAVPGEPLLTNPPPPDTTVPTALTALDQLLMLAAAIRATACDLTDQ